MKLRVRQDYPAGLDHLWAAFGHADYPEAKYRALGSTAVHVLRFHATSDRIEVDLERTAPVVLAKIPGWARAFVGSEQRLRHHTHWRRVSPGRVEAELEIAVVGLPLRAQGSGVILELAEQQTRMTLSFDLVCRVPGFGAAMGRLFAAQVQEALQADQAFTLRYLQGLASDAGRRRLSSPG